MTYTVHEVFLTLQGEGHHAGRTAVFCRFTGCNLWTGRERDRPDAICRLCDTDFLGGAKYRTAPELARRLAGEWPGGGPKFAVLTGGEPLLQVDAPLLDALHWAGFYVAVETNGTVRPPRGVDWLCVSPKAGAPLAVKRADELKLVYPQEGLRPGHLEGFDAPIRSLQPMDAPGHTEANTTAAAEYCMAHPEWRLSIQQHKVVGLK